MSRSTKSTGKEYKLLSPTLLDRHNEAIKTEDRAYVRELSSNLEKTLVNFGIDGYIPRITVGPRVTRFEISLAPGVRVDKLIKHQNDIAVAMKTEKIRIQAPIPGKDAVGVEVPNKVSNSVYLRSLLESKAWNNSKAAIPLVFGCDIDGKAAILDLAKAAHLLVAASSQSEKYNCLNTIIMSLLFRFSPDDLKLIMIDPQVVDFEMYRPLPHLATPIINDPEKARFALDWGVNEMERRYKVLKKVKAKNLATFNSRQTEPQPATDDDGNVIPPKLPIIVIIMNELSDAMKGIRKVDVETDICRIAQKGRAVGIHLVIATQFPKKQVVTGLIKANIPTKIAFHMSDSKDSRVILDSTGAEKLLGKGDMLFNPPEGTSLERIQGAFISDPEIAKVIDEITAQCPQAFDNSKSFQKKGTKTMKLHVQCISIKVMPYSAKPESHIVTLPAPGPFSSETESDDYEEEEANTKLAAYNYLLKVLAEFLPEHLELEEASTIDGENEGFFFSCSDADSDAHYYLLLQYTLF